MTALESPWQADAACRDSDPELFFPGHGEDTRPAKEVCRTCPVSEACLEYALANGERHGVWGGCSERERDRIRRKRSTARLSIIIDCAMCGARFRAGSNGAKYCGSECRKAGIHEAKARYERGRRSA